MPLITSLFSALERLGSKPRDLYTFARSDQLWRYTSAGAAITVTYPTAHDVSYTPAVISRGNIQRGSETGAIKVHVKLARTTPVAAALREYRMHAMVLGIHRYQPGVNVLPVLQAYGDVAGVTLNEGWVEFDVVSAESLFSQPFPRQLFSQTCQLSTYGQRCGVNQRDFSTPATIVSIDGSTIVVDAVPMVAATYYDGGKIVLTATREELFVAVRDDVTFEIMGPVPDGVAPGDAVLLVAGDDHSLTTCHDKFNNVENFFGFNDLPITDPMQTGISA